MLLPQETREVACGNTLILSPTFVTIALLGLKQLIIIVHLVDTQCEIAFDFTSDWMKGGRVF